MNTIPLEPNISATLLVLVSAVLHAVWNAALKNQTDKMAVTAVMHFSSAVLILPAVAFIPLPSPQMAGLILLSIIAHSLYQQTLIKALTAGDLSVVYPIARGTGPLIVGLLAYFILAETLAPQDMLAVLIIVTGIMWTAITSIRRGAATHGTSWALVTGGLIASYTIIDAAGVRMAETGFVFIIWSHIAFGPFYLLSCFKIRGKALAPALLKAWKPGILLGILSYGGYAMALFAFRIGHIAEISALRETSILFATLLGIFWLREGFSKTKLVAACLIALGAILLKAF